MPVVILPDDLREQLEDSESGTINGTDGPGVAAYWASNRSARADIYLGLILDGHNINISSVTSRIKMQFSIAPPLFCQSEDLHFDPSKDKVMSIKVSRRLTSMPLYLKQVNGCTSSNN